MIMLRAFFPLDLDEVTVPKQAWRPSVLHSPGAPFALDFMFCHIYGQLLSGRVLASNGLLKNATDCHTFCYAGKASGFCHTPLLSFVGPFLVGCPVYDITGFFQSKWSNSETSH